MTRVLITGAGGYVGGRLSQVMSAGEKWEPRALVREHAPRLDIDQSVCDLATTDLGNLAEICEGIDVVVHLAGENEVDAAREPAATLASTAVATERLAEAAVQAGVRRFVYMSTIHVYGGRIAEGAVLTEDLRPEPRASYAISRLASEHLAAGVARDNFDLVVFRLSNSVGAPDHPSVDRWTLVTNDLSRQAAKTGRMELRSSGVQWRDFVSLGDVCSAISAASAVGESPIPPGTYNLGSGSPMTVRHLASLVGDKFEEVTGSRPELVAPAPDSAPRAYTVSIEKLARHGLTMPTPIAEAVEETVRFCVDHREELP